MGALTSSDEWTSPCASCGPRQSCHDTCASRSGRFLWVNACCGCGRVLVARASRDGPEGIQDTPQGHLRVPNVQCLSPDILDASPLHRSSLPRQPSSDTCLGTDRQPAPRPRRQVGGLYRTDNFAAIHTNDAVGVRTAWSRGEILAPSLHGRGFTLKCACLLGQRG